MLHKSIGPYKVIREIAEDRLGRVFEAIDATRKKHVIIKALRPETASRPEVVSRLYSKAETLALLNHPQIARLLGFIRENDKLYLVMEFVEGESLRSILKERGRLDPNLALAIFHQIFAGVKFAHELGVIHGDLKPSSIMVSNFAHIKILDFAIAPILGDLHLADPRRTSSVPYMAPERMRGEPGDVRSDIYSLGVILYESIAGRAPVAGSAQIAAHPAISESTILPPSLLVANCPKWLDAFLLRALAASPGDRFQSMAAMSQAMLPAVPVRSRRLSSNPARNWFRRGVQRISSGPCALIGRAGKVLGTFVTDLDSAANIARQKRAAATRSLQEAVIAVNPWNWMKRGAARFPAWNHRLRQQSRSVVSPALKIPAKLKEHFTGFTENNWKRYVVLATLLAAVMIETFIFGGANTLLSPDLNSIPAVNPNGAAQSILEPLNRGPAPAIERDAQPAPQPRIVNRMSRGGRISERTSGRGEDSHHEALNSRRTVTYRGEADNQSNQPAVQDVRVTEPAKRNPENNTAKPQLNVRWEN